MPVVDFRDAEVLRPIPSGVYRLRVVSCTEGISRSGHPYIQVVGEVTEGEYAGRKVSGFIHFSPNGQNYAFTALVALGFDEAVLRSGPIEIKPEDLVGLEFRAAVRVRVDDYGESNEIGRFLPSQEF